MVGADTTNPSSTIATWFNGAPSDVTRDVSAPNADVPSPLKSRVTIHWLPDCVAIPAAAFETCRPRTSAGARMYLVPPSREQAAIVSLGLSVPVPSRFAILVQSRDAYLAFSSGVTPLTGVAAVEVSEAAGTPDPVAKT